MASSEATPGDMIRPRHNGTKILFKSPILEGLSRTHISVPLIIFSTYSGVLLHWSVVNTSLSAGTTILLFFAGMFFFTLMEYLLHRYLFHMGTFTKLRNRMQYIMHGVHHEFPKDKTRLAMPPLVSITVATVLLLVLRAVLNDLVFAFLPGLLVGYSIYLAVHYMVHVHQPPKNFFKVLWINHSIHHYKHGESVFGVSSPLWDYVFRTNAQR